MGGGRRGGGMPMPHVIRRKEGFCKRLIAGNRRQVFESIKEASLEEIYASIQEELRNQ